MTIIDKIKNFFSGNKRNENNENVYYDSFDINNISFGDVILAKRYTSDREKEIFEKGHETGLFVVVSREGSNLVCCYCTSVEGKRGFFQLGEDHAIFNNKKTFTSVRQIRIIDDYSFMRKVGSLCIRDRQKIINRFNSNAIFYKCGDIVKKIDLADETKISVRDIIKINDNYYLVIMEDKNYKKLLKINNYDEGNYLIDFNEVDIDYDAFIIKNRSDFHYVNTIPRRQFLIIMKEFYNYRNRLNELKDAYDSKALKRGYIIKYNDKLYYVFNVIGNVANVFEIINDSEGILLNGNNYKTIYDNEINVNISSNEYDVIDIVSDKDMDMISNDRKRYFTKKKYEDRRENSKKVKEKRAHNFNIGDIIENNSIFGMKFIVIGIYEDILITISLYNFIEDNKIVYREFSNYNGALCLSEKIEKDILLKVKEKVEYFTNLGENVKVKKRERDSK